MLVGDKVQFLNDSNTPINLLCEDFFDPLKSFLGRCLRV